MNVDEPMKIDENQLSLDTHRDVRSSIILRLGWAC